MDEKKLTSANQSLLNRFEKQRLTIGDVLIDRQQSLVRQLKSWTRRLSTFKDDSSIRLHDRSTQKNLFIGIDDDENLQSLVLDLTKKLNIKKELDFIFIHLTHDEIVDSPFFLHIYWWKYADNIWILLQLVETFPSIITKVQLEGSIDHDKLEQSLFIQAINFLLQKISDEEEYEQDLDIILSLVERMNDTTNMTNLPLLLVCNDLLKINSIPSEKIKEIRKSVHNQEFITPEIIELVFDHIEEEDDLIHSKRLMIA
ncbi:17606_t:CDS:2 [Funneliformis geosporum]|nr:17606_t:CDS:2 [Funneliformis geosporum]